MGAACRELQSSVTLADDGDVVFASERTRLHQERCPGCRAIVEELRAAVRSSRQQTATLDEITRSSMLRDMAPALDNLAATYAKRTKPHWELRLGPIAVGASLAAAAAAALVFYLAGAHQREDFSVSPSADSAAIRPYLISGTLAATGGSLLGAALQQVELPAGARLRARVPHGDIALIGPAQLALRPAAEGGYRLDLNGGLLLAEVDPPPTPLHSRPPIQVTTDSVVITVVGTLFSVDNRNSATAVSISRGTVNVATGLESLQLTAHQSWRQEKRQQIGTVDTISSRLLGQHAATRLRQPDRAARLTFTDSAGATVWVGNRAIGTTPLVAWSEAGAAVQLSNSRPAEQAPAASDAPPSEPSPPARTTRQTSAPVATPTSWTTEERYHHAEEALAAHQLDEAESHWRDLIDHHPEHPLADLALYDLAQLATRRQRFTRAMVYVRRLLARNRDPALAEPAQWLKCRLTHELGGEFRDCLAEFRRAHPDSPHIDEATQWLDAGVR